MPRPDPLNNIMSTLRGSKSIDSNNVMSRKAGLQTERQFLGATPQGTMMPPQMGGAMGGAAAPPDVMPQQPGIQEGMSPSFQDQPNMMGVIVDALNEAIIGLKTEIHRATDSERKKLLEQEAQNIRERIIELGGDPVWADESIEEGLAKLRGLGVTGINRMRQENLTGIPAQAQPYAANYMPTQMPTQAQMGMPTAFPAQLPANMPTQSRAQENLPTQLPAGSTTQTRARTKEQTVEQAQKGQTVSTMARQRPISVSEILGYLRPEAVQQRSMMQQIPEVAQANREAAFSRQAMQDTSSYYGGWLRRRAAQGVTM